MITLSKGQIGWGLFLIGLPLCHIPLLPYLHIWNSQALYSYICLMIIAFLAIFNGINFRPSKPLAAWLLWTSTLFIYQLGKVMVNQKIIAYYLFPGYIHQLLIVLSIIFGYSIMRKSDIPILSKWVAVSTCILLTYCILQSINLDQFFHDIAPSVQTDNMVGVIGNKSHLGSHLSLLLPFLLYQNGAKWLPWIVLCGVVIYLSDSVSAWISSYLALSWYFLNSNKRLFWIALVSGIIATIYIIFNGSILNPHGRFEAWTRFYDLFSKSPITGNGSGAIMEYTRGLNVGEKLFGWIRVHNEYYQIAIEQGLIGLSIVLFEIKNLILSILTVSKSKEGLLFGGMLISFLSNSVTNYTAHLWILSSLGLFAYCGLKVLTYETPQPRQG